MLILARTPMTSATNLFCRVAAVTGLLLPPGSFHSPTGMREESLRRHSVTMAGSQPCTLGLRVSNSETWYLPSVPSACPGGPVPLFPLLARQQGQALRWGSLQKMERVTDRPGVGHSHVDKHPSLLFLWALRVEQLGQDWSLGSVHVWVSRARSPNCDFPPVLSLDFQAGEGWLGRLVTVFQVRKAYSLFRHTKVPQSGIMMG